MSKTCPICECGIDECGELTYDENFECECCEDCSEERENKIMYEEHLLSQCAAHYLDDYIDEDDDGTWS